MEQQTDGQIDEWTGQRCWMDKMIRQTEMMDVMINGMTDGQNDGLMERPMDETTN